MTCTSRTVSLGETSQASLNMKQIFTHISIQSIQLCMVISCSVGFMQTGHRRPISPYQRPIGLPTLDVPRLQMISNNPRTQCLPKSRSTTDVPQLQVSIYR